MYKTAGIHHDTEYSVKYNPSRANYNNGSHLRFHLCPQCTYICHRSPCSMCVNILRAFHRLVAVFSRARQLPPQLFNFGGVFLRQSPLRRLGRAYELLRKTGSNSI